MPKDIEPRLRKIYDYLKIGKSECFVIPEYQRGYSWTITQCDKLFQDIENFIDFIDNKQKKYYFFGTIIVDCSDGNNFTLVDGQQRITTFLLLLKSLLLIITKVLLNDFKKDEETESLEQGLKEKRNLIIDILYKTDSDDRLNLLKNWNKTDKPEFIVNKSINELYKEELQTILNAETFDIAEKNCIKIPRKQKDNKYTQFFKNFKFFYKKLEEYGETKLNKFAKTFLEGCQIIEIRSWQLEQAITMFNSLNSTGMPLSDANIISALLHSNSDDKKLFNRNWEEIIKITNDLSLSKIIDIDSILQEYMYIKRAKDKEYIKNDSVDVATPGVRNYYTNLHGEILKNPKELCENFLKIINIWEKIKNYPIIKLLLKFNENIKIYLISYLNRYEKDDISKEKVLEISECLIRLFTILELVDTGYSSSNFKTFLFKENVKLVDNNYSYSQIQSDFDKHISEKWNKEDIENYLSDYNKNVLVFLNEYLYAKEKGLSFDFDESVNIEHIMPASGHNIEIIRKDAGFDSEEDFNSAVNTLGNKILLEESINKSIGNEWFKTKKQNTIKSKTGYKDTKYVVAKELVNYKNDSWRAEDIKEATNKVIERILKFIFND